MKKILLLQSNGLGDRIASLPYLLNYKGDGKNKLYLLDFGKGYRYQINPDIMKIYNQYKLYDGLLIVPFNKIKLVFFIFRYLLHFDEVYIPVKSSFKTVILGRLLGKKIRNTFKNLNDDSKYNNIVDGLMGKKCCSLYDMLHNQISFPYDKGYEDKYDIKIPYVIIFVGPYSRSLIYEEWNRIFDYIHKHKLKIILVGSSSIERESRINNHLDKANIENYNILDLIGKTNFIELCSLIKDAKLCICANGGIMWMAHALNKNVISFSTCSGFITHPPVDNKTQFHIYKKTNCLPCEQNGSENYLLTCGFKQCSFYKTNKEAICKKNISCQLIIACLDKIL